MLFVDADRSRRCAGCALSRASRFLTECARKPRSSTRSPRAMASMISSRPCSRCARHRAGTGGGFPRRFSGSIRIGSLRFLNMVPMGWLLAPILDGAQAINDRTRACWIGCGIFSNRTVQPSRQKRPRTSRGANSLRSGDQPLLFSAAPRMSPARRPRSSCHTGRWRFFSSAISRALIDRPRRRVLVSMLVTRTSAWSPVWKRSGRWSDGRGPGPNGG